MATSPLLNRRPETATEQVKAWKFSISRDYHWYADDILEEFTTEFLSTPDDIKHMKNDMLKLQRLVDYSATHEEMARLLLKLLAKKHEDAFWELSDEQEGNNSYNTLSHVIRVCEQCFILMYLNSTGDHHLQRDCVCRKYPGVKHAT